MTSSASTGWRVAPCSAGFKERLSVWRNCLNFRQPKSSSISGGGHGLFGIAFAQENPDLEVVVFDKPEVIPMTRGYIDRYKMGDRVSTLEGDYTKDPIGSDYGIAFEACSFGGRGDEALSFYRQVASALKDGGLFIRLTFTIDDDRKGPLTSLIWDLKEQITGQSHMHMKTNAELFETLAEAGFQRNG